MADSLRDRNVLIIGAGQVGRATAGTLAAAGARVLATGRDRDATDPAQVAKLLAEADPDVVVVTAGARPRMAPVTEQDWTSFSAAWEVDVRIAFEVGRAALARPLRPGATVVIVSSGAGFGGSPLSGGYAGAKRMQAFLAGYLQREADAGELGIRFVALVPRQLITGTQIGAAAAEVYGAGGYLNSATKPLEVGGVARAVLAVVGGGAHSDATVIGVSGDGLAPM